MTTWTRPDAGRAWAYAGATLGGAVSIAANVAHSYVPPDKAPTDWTPATGAVIGAVFWPVALFVAVEILARVTWPVGLRWVVLRFGGLLPVALFAAVVSYLHMSGLLAFYGEDGITSTFGPLAVDGLMVMAAAALIATKRVQKPNSPITSFRFMHTLTPAAPAAAKTPAAQRAKTRPRVAAKTAQPGRPSKAAEILRVAAKSPDLTPAEIAKKTGASVRTVNTHLAGKNPAVNGTPVTTGAP